MQSARSARLGEVRTAAAIFTTSSVYYLRPRTESDSMVGQSASKEKPNMCTVNRAQIGPIPTTNKRCTSFQPLGLGLVRGL